jgi:uncharacterized protein
MSHRPVFVQAVIALLALAMASGAPAADGVTPTPAPLTLSPLVIGDTFTLDSAALAETRRINVYAPPGYAESPDQRLPVLYMPDGGLGEDFLHIAGLVQIGAINGTMRPFLLVGIENTQRRRDLTGPTTDKRDLAIAPKVGGSAAYRAFLRDELMPRIDATYRTTGETAMVGESLAGLFVVESFLQEPGLFDTAIAIDPSLWWNHAALVEGAAARLASLPDLQGTLFLASSDEPEIVADAARLAGILAKAAPTGLKWSYTPLPAEQHSTIYHPAALRAFREVFAPPAAAGK